MTCDERQDLLLLYVSGALDPAEEAELRAHLATGCTVCAGALAQAETTFHQIPLSLSAHPAPAGAWDKIEARIAMQDPLAAAESAREHAALAAPLSPQPRKAKSYSYIHWAIGGAGWAAAAGIALMASIELNKSYESLAKLQEKNQQAIDQFKDVQLQFTNLQRQFTSIQEQNQLQMATWDEKNKDLQRRIGMLMRSDQFPVTGKEQPLVQGKLFWDKPSKKWTLTVTNVKPLPAGKTYELWIVAAGKTLAAGTAQPDAAGILTFDATLPDDAGTINAAAVTDEPGPNGVPVATGQIQFLAAVTPG